MEDRFKFTLDFLKEQFNNRLEIDTKEVSKVLDINESTLWRRMKYGETHLLPKFRISGPTTTRKPGKYKWPIYDLAVFLTQEHNVSA